MRRKMKGIVLWQPWALLIAAGVKHIETRKWKTAYRGPLAICAAVRTMTSWERDMYFVAVRNLPAIRKLPVHYGSVVATCRLADCLPSREIKRMPVYQTGTESLWGNYGEGMWGWILEDVVPLKEPQRCVGSQGLFDIVVDLQANQ